MERRFAAMHLGDFVYSISLGRAGLPRVTNIQAATLGGVILVSWNAPIEPVAAYMVDWTHGGDRYYWKESRHTNTTLCGRLENGHFVVAICFLSCL